MADREIPSSTQHRVASSPEPQSEGQAAESGWKIALKALFWFIVAPASVLLLAKWLIEALSG